MYLLLFLILTSPKSHVLNSSVGCMAVSVLDFLEYPQSEQNNHRSATLSLDSIGRLRHTCVLYNYVCVIQ